MGIVYGYTNKLYTTHLVFGSLTAALCPSVSKEFHFLTCKMGKAQYYNLQYSFITHLNLVFSHLINKYFPNVNYILVRLLEDVSGMSKMKVQSLMNEVSTNKWLRGSVCWHLEDKYVFRNKIARAYFSENVIIEMRLERMDEQNCCMK